MRKTISRILLPASAVGMVVFGSAVGISAADTLYNCPNQIVRPGDTDQKFGNQPCVTVLQGELNKQGFHIGPHGRDAKPDGNFGPDTETAVKNFQSAENLHQDGVVGQKTWACLISPPGSSPGQACKK